MKTPAGIRPIKFPPDLDAQCLPQTMTVEFHHLDPQGDVLPFTDWNAAVVDLVTTTCSATGRAHSSRPRARPLNWNAPLVFLLAGIQSAARQEGNS